MSGKVLDNSFALCREMDTNLFYMYEEELIEKDFSLLKLRTICFSCPIWRECSAYGWQYERHGMFGGLTGEERDAIRRKMYESPRLKKLMSDLKELGVSFNAVTLYETGTDDLFP